ncbi:MAG: hypothetical protein JJE13_01795 [Thermoleophilia bacterium]|nr:hypothetical protein [Thermoleophilia bacterium]
MSSFFRSVRSTRLAAIAVLTFAIGFTCLAGTASARPTPWGGTGSNDIGRGTLLLTVANGRVTVRSLQAIMACTDTSDGHESERAFSTGRGITVNLNQNRYSFRYAKFASGRLGYIRLQGRLRSNGVGNGHLDLIAVGIDQGSNTVIENCQASLNYRLRRGPST